jgi:hypothetical protein
VTGRWFSPGTPVSYTNKTDHCNITEILLKVALNTMTIALTPFSYIVAASFIGGGNRKYPEKTTDLPQVTDKLITRSVSLPINLIKL